jgi:hypothetical protein
MKLLDNLKNLAGGKITIHQEFINKFIKETLDNNEIIKEILLTAGEGSICASLGLLIGEGIPVNLKFEFSLGKYEFNKSNRFVELILLKPAAISIFGINIKAKLAAGIDEAEAIRAGAPGALIKMFNYLSIYEDKYVLDFNKMPGFNKALQNKLSFLLKNLEITELELKNEMLLLHPSIKFF